MLRNGCRRFSSRLAGKQVRSSYKSPAGLNGDKASTSQSDIVYDGAAQVVLMGSTFNPSKEWLAQQKQSPGL